MKLYTYMLAIAFAAISLLPQVLQAQFTWGEFGFSSGTIGTKLPSKVVRPPSGGKITTVSSSDRVNNNNNPGKTPEKENTTPTYAIRSKSNGHPADGNAAQGRRDFGSFLETPPRNRTQIANINRDILVEEAYSKSRAFVQEAASHSLHPIKAFPNPFESQLRVSLESSLDTEFQLKVINLQGAVVFTATQATHSATGDLLIDTSAWDRGVYFILISSPNSVQYTRLVKN